MMLSLFAKYGRSDELALASSLECLPAANDWTLRQRDAIDSRHLMLDQQSAVQKRGYIRGR